VLKVYALKTAPAFEAALACGVVLGRAGEPIDADEALRLRTLSRHVGIGFQVRNDLDGWTEDCRAARPTYLTALALRAVIGGDRVALIAQIRACGTSDAALAALRDRYEALGVFEQAQQLRERLHGRAIDTAAQLSPPPLAELAGFLVELILG
jgi:geranylgeranyl pyrophosphate synthase